MALRKDYIMRQFEEFGKVMAVIFGLKREQDWGKFEKEISDASQKFVSVEIDKVEAMEMSGFEKEVSSLFPDQQKILADLLFEKLNYYYQIGENKRSEVLKSKCLFLYKKYADNLTQNEFNLDVHYILEIMIK